MVTLPKVHRFVSAESGFYVNSYWLETAESVIVIDTQFLISEAQKLRQEIKASGKPLKAVIITHPHPDHFNGTGVLVGDSAAVPVYATQPTLEVIKATEGAKRTQWKGTYGADYPDFTVLPNQIVASGEKVTIEGLEFEFRDIGAGESANLTLVSLAESGILFCTDLVYNQVHPWLAEGRSSAWIEQLGFVLKNYPQIQTVYPGHGAPTSLVGLNAQLGYINTVQLLVRQQLALGTEFSDAAKAAIKTELEARYPNQPLAMLHDWNIDGVVKELAVVSQ